MLYIPPAFGTTNADALKMIEKYPFAILASWGIDCHITHMPMFLSEDGLSLYGHFAGANPHSVINPAEFKHHAIFNGPNAYISPGWCEDQNQVPTWNYKTAHFTGTLELVSNPMEVETIVATLTRINEATFASPWTMDKLDDDKRDRLISAITGCQLRIETIECKFKLSQNKPTETRNLIEGLRSRESNSPEDDIADAMLERIT